MLLRGLRAALPSLDAALSSSADRLEVIEAEAAVIVVLETMLLHRQWLKSHEKKKSNPKSRR